MVKILNLFIIQARTFKFWLYRVLLRICYSRFSPLLENWQHYKILITASYSLEYVKSM